MPAAPIIGLIFLPFFKKRFKNFAKRTPPAVSKMNATRPSPIIISVSFVRKYSACIFVAIVMPKNSVIRFARIFCAVSESESKTPHSLIKLPNIKNPISATLRGETIPVIMVITIGKRIFVRLEIDFCS